MEDKLNYLFNECIKELEGIGIIILNNPDVGEISIKISKRNNKRYACCKQEEPDESTKTIRKHGKILKISYNKFNKHNIEVSSWVMNLDDDIIKNTIIHEIIHCLPNCNNHGKIFKEYAEFINKKLGYNIKTSGNKEEDFKKSNLEFIKEPKSYRYEIKCMKCGAIIYRQRLKKDLIKKYRCSRCGGKLSIVSN